MKRFCEALLKLEKGIGGALLLLMLVVVFFATVGRYTGLYNMSWSDEAARYLMIWFVFLLAGLSAFRGEMFSIDLVTEHLSVTGQKVFAVIRLVLMTAFCIFAVVYGADLVLHQAQIHQTSPSLKLPMWFMYSSVPLGCLILELHYIALTWLELRKPGGKGEA